MSRSKSGIERYFWVNPERVHSGLKEMCVDGIDFLVELSPYDMPVAIQAKHDKQQGHFCIRFEYIDKEPPSAEKSVYDGVEFQEGKHSGKLLCISIPIDNPPLHKVAVVALRTRARKALSLRKKKLRDTRVLNQEVAEEILEEDEFQEFTNELVS